MDESPGSSERSDGVPKTPDWVIDTYKEICANIRNTAEISFKLLGIVPISAGVGAGALVLLEKSKLLEAYTVLAVISLSLLGAAVTFGLCRWELRNIQRCVWLISRAANIEAQIMKRPNLQYDGMAKEEHRTAKGVDTIYLDSLFDWNWHWGKTRSEKLVYSAAVASWFVPLALALVKWVTSA
jgi:hypothetical protein